MHELPFTIPESLASYAVHFESSPEEAVKRLKKQLNKRGPDAVGYFLLGWFYHRQGQQDEAIECALKAKNFAPGSPFFKKLHYFFAHPQMFNAWEYTETSLSQTKRFPSLQTSGPISDLNSLIEKLSAMKSTRIQHKNKDATPSDSGSSFSLDSGEVDDIVSETLARIHVEQGKIDDAIRIYEKLRSYNKPKKDEYQEEIARLKKLKKSEEGKD